MIASSREGDRSTKREGEGAGSGGNDGASGSSVSWLRLKDPRIVRVSRAFGGKDRHSKVCTVRGLRDRRVRLSVSTAIQLYDLQERLGLNQPSKVVDWLLDAAKHEIDELPPLQIPPAQFINTGILSLNKGIDSGTHHDHHHEDLFEFSRSSLWGGGNDPRKFARDMGKQESGTTQNHVPVAAGLLSNSVIPHHFQLDPLTFSHSQAQAHDNNPASGYSTTMPPSSSQLFLCTPAITDSYIQSHATASASVPDHFDPKFLSSPSQNLLPITSQSPFYTSIRPFDFGMFPKFVPSQHGMINSDLLHKDGEFPPK
ncbi:hypothetical protein Nepgr_022197 [Nepenthes gracilis]|uniref:TCP domain-containing protein n=1 Tax=Nepenthes gracilis TaxID=150966 RepID=A0AAD3XY57_NEPGR|nr:hypothetical protein Nepgr_022197 [Nepenthes gracilis]